MNKMRFDDALELLMKLVPEEAYSGDMIKYAGKCDCQKCAYCAYWRLRDLIWNFYEIRLNSRQLDKHIQGLYE